jgi:predicted Fe-Mo cluster-binding NifX family protein
MSSEWVIVRTFANHIEADLAASVLEAAGIESTVQADDCGGAYPNLWNNGIHVRVAPESLTAAAEVLTNAAVSVDVSPVGDDGTAER